MFFSSSLPTGARKHLPTPRSAFFAWFETKIFFNDYLTASISIIIVIIVFAGIGYGIFRVTRRIIMKTKG